MNSMMGYLALGLSTVKMYLFPWRDFGAMVLICRCLARSRRGMCSLWVSVREPLLFVCAAWARDFACIPHKSEGYFGEEAFYGHDLYCAGTYVVEYHVIVTEVMI